ncbi:TetR/AcrR family transcriptional regulator [Kribbella sp. NPDC058245]|uniref:TetR/AcrR family transcriptional regulator n=1 Tax=Kribbella sp. NPDC058245 TaxID=3346399 RepID=UPI0036E69F31
MAPTTAGSERRVQILNEAQRLFNQQGFRETNLDDVAVRLGVKRQAIYYYFKSKEDILWELVERASTTLAESAESIFTADLPPERKIEALVDNHVRQLLGDIEIFRLDVLQRDKLSTDRHESVRKSQHEYVRRIAEIITEGQETGRFVAAAPYVQTLLIIGMCNWTLDWYRPESSTTVDDVAAEAVRMVMAGLAARRPRTRKT